MSTFREVAEAFSGHRFPDAGEETRAEPAAGTSEFLRFHPVADGDRVAVDAVGRYTDAGGEISVVSSCDLYESDGGELTTITSYTVELDPEPGAADRPAGGG